jgi:ubiquinone/menaquinone biosynthesis C-methylase UbiE
MAWFLSRGMTSYSAHLDRRKAGLFKDLYGTLVEIGSGTGSNLGYLPRGVRIVGVEPNPFMHRHFLKRARGNGKSIHLIQGVAESLPFPDDSVENVLSTLVLCSVERTDRVLAEVLRVLRPGGRFFFVEHVAADPGTRLNRIQSWVRPVWSRIGDGCEPDRTTEVDLRKAGFSEVHLDRFQVPVALVSPHIAGVARK